MTQYIEPRLLGIVPPMDLGLGDSEFISPFPLKARVHDNSRPTVGSVGLFGARRDVTSPGLIRLHDGLDLLAPIGTPVFASQSGTVLAVGEASLTLEHTKGFHYLTYYQHLQNIKVIVDQRVTQGTPIAEVGPFTASDSHLHFEIRYPFDRPVASYENSLPVDPTWALYEWEKKRYRNDDSSRKVLTPEPISEFGEIIRGRLLRFLRIRVPQFGRNLYYPLDNLTEEGRSLVETLRMAFLSGRRVEIAWRDSLFFNQIEFLFNQNDKVPIIAEVRVFAT